MKNMEEIRRACVRNSWQIEGLLHRRRELETGYGPDGLITHGEYVVCEDDGHNQYTLCVDQFSDYDGYVFVVTADEQLYEFR